MNANVIIKSAGVVVLLLAAGWVCPAQAQERGRAENLSYDTLNAQTRGKQFTVYGEVNWLHNTRNVNATLDNVRVEQAGSRNVGEVKLGLEGQVTDTLTLWTNLAHQVGTKSYSDTSANIGIKYHF